MNSLKPSHAILVGLISFIALIGFFGAQAKVTSEPSRAVSAINSTATIFTKDKVYRLKILQTFGIAQRWVDCKVLDTRDNWVKCSGVVYDVGGKPDEKFEAWLNTDYISWVQEWPSAK